MSHRSSSGIIERSLGLSGGKEGGGEVIRTQWSSVGLNKAKWGSCGFHWVSLEVSKIQWDSVGIIAAQ